MKLWTQWNYLRIIFLIFCGYCHASHTEKRMKMIYTWKSLEFDFGSEAARVKAIDNEEYIPGVSVPIDVDVYEKDTTFNKTKTKVFITIPRLDNGVPTTVGYVTDKKSLSGDPIIAPYPNWQWNKQGNCDAITSVYRVRVDSCKRIWILDTGKIGTEQVCSPQLLSFSLETDRLLSRYKFPRNQYKDDSLLVTAVVDVPVYNFEQKCQDTFVYIADVTGFALIVYDHRKGRSWKIINKYFYPYPRHGTFHIRGESFELMDGILGLALSSPNSDGEKVLFFHSLSGVEEGWVKTSVIKNETLFANNAEAVPAEFHVFDQVRSSQAAPEDIDRNGVLFFGLMSDLAIGCWNVNNFPNYGGNMIQKLVINSNTLQFASGVKVIQSKKGYDQLWVLTSSFQKYMTGKLKSNEINFRIQAAVTSELIRGTKCAPQANGNNLLTYKHY